MDPLLDDPLKLLAQILILIVATVTIQFTIADYISKRRDNYAKCTTEKSKRGESGDLYWGYCIGFIINVFFCVIAFYFAHRARRAGYSIIIYLLPIFYVANLISWVWGLRKDRNRLKDISGPVEGTEQV